MSLSETRFGANATGLPGPTPLPSLTAALSRRAALFGAVTVAGCTAVTSTVSTAGVASEAGRPAVPQSAALSAPVGSADRHLAVAANTLDVLQATADRHASGAGPEPADPYTQAVAEMDLVAAGMAMMPADTMAGVLIKLRAMDVPILRDDDEAHGLALSVCRDGALSVLRRATGGGVA